MTKHDVIDTIKVVAANIGAITITAADIKNWLSIVSLLLAMSYTAWKWINDSKKKKVAIKKYNEEKSKHS